MPVIAKWQEKEGLVNRALSKANGANIHDIRVLCGYYRSAISIGNSYKNLGMEEKARQTKTEIARYEEILEFFASTGRLPEKQP